MIYNLPSTRSKCVNHIIHLADIHIRGGSNGARLSLEELRFNEYMDVIDKLVNFVQDMDTDKRDSTIVVIAGDIFHDKGRFVGHSIKILNRLLNGLSNLIPVYLFAGNHDNQVQKNDNQFIESLEPLLENYNHNIFYMKYYGYYNIDNVTFSLIPIMEIMEKGCNNTEIKKEIKEFPKAENINDSQIKIALAHTLIGEQVNISYFGNGYDLCLLGDNHKMQIQNAKKINHTIDMKHVGNNVYHIGTYERKDTKMTWAYSGSMIQQNHGESLIGHGFILWNVSDKDNITANLFHIQNSRGFAKLFVRNYEWMINIDHPEYSNKMIKLNNYKDFEYLPRNLDIIYKNYDEELHRDDIINRIEKSGINCTRLKYAPNNLSDTIDIDNFQTIDSNENESFNSIDTWIAYIDEFIDKEKLDLKNDWKSWIKQPEYLLLEDDKLQKFHISSLEKNKKIIQLVDNYNLAKDTTQNLNRFKINFIKFSNILCYGEDCYIDFDNFDKKITLILGSNGIGKTALLETICIALYGEGMPSRRHKSHSASIISVNKRNQSRSCTKIIFQINNKKYRISRSFNFQDEHKLHTKDIVLEDLDTNQKLLVGKTTVDKWVNENICDIGSFLTSVMITQGFDYDFFELKSQEQKQKIDDALCIKSSSCFKELLKQSSLAYNSIKKELNLVQSNLKFNYDFDENKINKCHDDIQHTIIDIKQIQNDIEMYNDKLKGYDTTYLSMDKTKLEELIIDTENNIKKFNNVGIEELLSNKGSMEHQLEKIKQSGICVQKNIQELYDELDSIQLKDKPEWSLEYIDQEIDKVHKDIKNKEIINVDENILQDLIENKNNILEEIDQNKKSFDKTFQVYKSHIKNKPIFSVRSIEDYNEWNNNIQKYVEKYGSIDNVPMPDSIDKPRLREPTMTSFDIDNMNTRIVNEMEELRLTSIADIHVHYDNIIEKYNLYLEQENNIHKKSLENKTNIKKILCKKELLNKKLLKHIENKIINERNKDVINKDLKSMKKEFKDYNPEVDTNIVEYGVEKIDTIDNLINERENYNEFLNEFKEYTFNSKCKACMKNPIKLKQDLYTDKINQVNENIMNIQNDMINKIGKIINTEDFKKSLEKINNYKRFLKVSEDYEECIKVDKLVKKWETSKKVMENDIDICTQEYDALTKDAESLESSLYDIIKSKNFEKDLLDKYDNFKKNYLPFIEEIAWNKESIIAYDIYNKRIEEITFDFNEYTRLDNQRDYWNTEVIKHKEWTDWQGIETKLQEELDSYKIVLDNLQTNLELKIKEIYNLENIIQNNKNIIYLEDLLQKKNYYKQLEKKDFIKNCINYNKIVQELSRVDKDIQECKDRDLLIKNMNIMKDAYSVLDEYNLFQKSLYMLNESSNKLGVLETEYNVLKQNQDQYDNQINIKNEINELVSKYSNIIYTCDKIYDMLNNFKTWLFENKAIPLLCRKVNDFLHILTQNSRPIKLECEVQKDELTWYINDDNLKIILNKASGFQKLAISFAMRLALGKLGVSGINTKQLFIDESFVFFDKNNLECIPDFLKAILCTYDQIYMVTHLECLKDSCNAYININRDNGISNVNIDGKNRSLFDKNDKNGKNSKNDKNSKNEMV